MKGQPYLDHIVGIFAPKQATRVDAIRSDRAAMEFRGLPPSARDELKKELGDQIASPGKRLELRQRPVLQRKKKAPFDDPRVRARQHCRWRSTAGAAPGGAFSKIAIVKAVGGIVFPGSPLAATKEELEQMAGVLARYRQVTRSCQAAAEGSGGRKT